MKVDEPIQKRLEEKENTTGQSLRPGAGSQARFANIFGLTLLPDGSLVGADQTANSIFQVQDPFGAGCKMTILADTTKTLANMSPGNPPNVGGLDANAHFAPPQWPAVVGKDIYFIDEGNSKIKQVAADAARTMR